jgi:hypothetical protein
MLDPCCHDLPRRRRDLELNRALRLLLQHDRPRCHAIAVANVADAQTQQVAGA